MARIAVLIGVAGVSTAAILVRYTQAAALTVAAYRLLFAFLFLLPAWIVQQHRTRAKPRARELAWSALAGMCLALHWALWFAALGLTGVASATTLVNMHPLFVLLGAFLCWRQVPRRSSLWAIALALVGSALISAGDTKANALLGDLLAFMSAAAVAVYLLIGQQVRRSGTLLQYVVPVYGCGAVVAIIAALVLDVPLAAQRGQDWLLFVLLAAVPTLGGHTIFNWALQYMPATHVSLAILGEPVLAAVWAALIFAERPGLLQVCGAVAVLAGLGIYTYTDVTGREPAQGATRRHTSIG